MGIPLSNTPLLLPTGFLSTSGNQFIDSSGNYVKIAAIDWDGAEYGGAVATPLWHSNHRDILDGIKAAGFNCIRYNFSDATLSDRITAATLLGGDTVLGTVNTTVNTSFVTDMTFFDATDIVVNYCTAIGLKIFFAKMGNDHNKNVSTGLWYGDVSVTNQQCIDNLVAIANRYIDNSTVIGVELNNEVQAPPCTFNTNSTSDIVKFWTDAGNAIHAVNPNILIICQAPQAGTGYDHTLDGSCILGRLNPTLPSLTHANKCVISVHSYPSMISGNVIYTSSNLQRTFGYIFSNNSYPILISEMGYPNDFSLDKNGHYKDQAGCEDWRNTLFAFIESGIQNIPSGGFGPSWTWFNANPSSPTDGFGSGLDTGYGLLRWSDSKTPIDPPFSVLSPHLFYGGGGGLTGITKAITINTISQRTSSQSFSVSGSLTGYQTAPSLQYSDGANLWLNLPSNSTITSSTFSFTHPGLLANSSAVVSVRDRNDSSVQANSTAFAVVDPVVTKVIQVQDVGGPYPEQTTFNVQGTLQGYNYAPLLEYRDNSGTWNPFPQSSVINSTDFTFVHPGISAGSGITVSVRDSDFNNILGTSSPFTITIVLHESNQGATLTAPSNTSIYDEDFTEYNLATSTSFGLQVTINGVADNTTANVAMLLYWDHVIYYQNVSGNFFSKLNTSNVWRQTTDPRVAIPKSCTVTLPSITANVQFTIAGTLVGYTITPQLQYQDNGGVWNSLPANSALSNTDFSFVHAGVPFASAFTIAIRDKNIPTVTAIAATTISKADESPEASVIRQPTNQTIVDSAGNYWGLSSDNKVIFNGVVDDSTSQVLLLYYTNHVIYYQAVNQSWFKKPNILQQWLLTTSPYLHSPTSDAAKIQAANQSINLLVTQLNTLLKRLQPTEIID